MPRPRKPTAIKEQSGAFKKDPQRRPQAEPVPDGELPPAPDYLNEFEKEIWIEFVAVIPQGVAFNSDQHLVESAVRGIAKMRKTPTMDLKMSDLQALGNLLSKMGMTPADRSRVNIVDKPKANPFSSVA